MRRIDIGSLWGSIPLLVLLFSLISPLSASQSEISSGEGLQKRTLYVCANPHSLPYSSQDPSTPGYEVEIGNEVGKILGMKVSTQWIVAFRSKRELSDCDILVGVIQTEEEDENPRARFFRTKPYYGTGYVLVLPKEAREVQSLDELDKSLKIGIEPGSWAHYIASQKGFPVTRYITQEEIVEGVANQEVQAGLAVAAAVGWYLKQHPDAPVKIPEGYIPEPDLRWNVVMEVNKEDKDLEGAINVALDQLIQSQTIPSIMAKYGVPYYAPFPLPKEKED